MFTVFNRTGGGKNSDLYKGFISMENRDAQRQPEVALIKICLEGFRKSVYSKYIHLSLLTRKLFRQKKTMFKYDIEIIYIINTVKES